MKGKGQSEGNKTLKMQVKITTKESSVQSNYKCRALSKVKTTKTWKGTHKPHEKPHGNIADQAINHLKALAKKQAEERNAT